MEKEFKVGLPLYALYFGPRRNQKGKWVAAIVTKRLGSRSVDVRVPSKGPIWRQHFNQRSQ